ncbi:uncharacterized protein [Parasteatoda tepidariorum]|uniref:uncharacterized protein n=1 Tax=Parasteatoda tepidariorum TaxID=114398 RepID=UPI001C71BF53|nr:uncharacterized protein LOC107444149 [Parasteatoda tepidariorum]
MFSKRCQTMWIEIVFDGFDVTNMTYNAKFESMELFSVIGGYMGMYLGVSIVAVYDFAEIVMTGVYTFWRKHSKKKKQSKKRNQKIFNPKVHSQFENDFRRMESLRGGKTHKMY